MADDQLAPLSAVSGELQVVKEWFHQDYRLQPLSGGPAVATLDYSFGGTATAHTVDAGWKLSHAKGIRHAVLEVTDLATGALVTSMQVRLWWRGGDLVIDGLTYTFASTLGFGAHKAVTREGVELLRVSHLFSLAGKGAHLTVTEAGRTDPHLDLLCLLSVHQFVTAQRQQVSPGLLAHPTVPGGALTP